MKKENRLKKNEDFQIIFQQGTSVANRQFVVYYLRKADQECARIGLSVSKKLGNAVTRNRIKRLMREALSILLPDISKNYDVVIIARRPTIDMELQQFRNSITHVLKLSGVLKKRVQRSL
ncbi:ribonuclease P protein component [Evansella sp. AB-rgal1]|uniref:ribonuclease P protein component n=1 Tax=Evansella sp. AB-rgal1 TaxID=3242696 RepID=UPI00359E0985